MQRALVRKRNVLLNYRENEARTVYGKLINDCWVHRAVASMHLITRKMDLGSKLGQSNLICSRLLQLSNNKLQLFCPGSSVDVLFTLKWNSRLTRNGKEMACRMRFSFNVCSTCFSFTTWKCARWEVGISLFDLLQKVIVMCTVQHHQVK